MTPSLTRALSEGRSDNLRLPLDVLLTNAAARHAVATRAMIVPGKRSATVSAARQRFVAQAIASGYSKAQIARALHLDWTSVHSLAGRQG